MLLLNCVSIFVVLMVNRFAAVDASSLDRLSACGRVVMSECWCLDENPCDNDHKSKTEADIPIIDEENLLIADDIRARIRSISPDDLEIPGRGFEGIDRNAFDNFTNLRRVNLDNNKLVRLSEFVFSKLTNLTELKLGFNGLVYTKNVFAGLGNLKTLLIDGNPLTEILADDCFYGVPKSANVWIRGAANVRKIGTNAFGSESSASAQDLANETSDNKRPKAKSVQTRSADWTSAFRTNAKMCVKNGTLQLLDLELLESTEIMGDSCKTLDYRYSILDLSYCGITNFAKGWYRLHDKSKVPYSLSSLNLKGNQIARVTSDVVNDLPAYITWLTLTENKIERLEKGTFQHRTIFSLELNSNLITEIEDDTFKMPKLYQLYLQNNRLRDTKFAATLPSGLTSMDLADNEIEEISPDSFSNLKNLRFLNLQNNKITVLHSQGMRGMTTLGSFILSNNKIVMVEPGAFEGLDLGSLDLGGNNITSVVKGVFAGVVDLQSLYLDNNNIKKIRIETFDLPDLKSLDLKNNRISEIEKGALKNLGKLNTLDISNNPIKKLENGVLFGLNKMHGTHVVVSKNQIALIQGGVFDDV